jgi:arylsulfatase
MNNLAMPNAEQRELVVAMNDKLNRLIDTEVGEDRGQMLPGGVEAGWGVTADGMAP